MAMWLVPNNPLYRAGGCDRESVFAAATLQCAYDALMGILQLMIELELISGQK